MGKFLSQTAPFYNLGQAAYILSLIMIIAIYAPVPQWLMFTLLLISIFAFMLYKEFVKNVNFSFSVLRIRIKTC